MLLLPVNFPEATHRPDVEKFPPLRQLVVNFPLAESLSLPVNFPEVFTV